MIPLKRARTQPSFVLKPKSKLKCNHPPPFFSSTRGPKMRLLNSPSHLKNPWVEAEIEVELQPSSPPLPQPGRFFPRARGGGSRSRCATENPQPSLSKPKLKSATSHTPPKKSSGVEVEVDVELQPTTLNSRFLGCSTLGALTVVLVQKALVSGTPLLLSPALCFCLHTIQMDAPVLSTQSWPGKACLGPS